jgi:UDP-glucose 4-epimerase
MRRILVTGSEGLVGTELARSLCRSGYDVRRFDLRCPPTDPGRGDILNAEEVTEHASQCDGIVHLAAISRVIWGEQDPELCWSTNVAGTQNVLRAALASPRRPWVLFASSREVYGEPDHLPVAEDCQLKPVNVYGRSKAEGERLVLEARQSGLVTAVLRFSNVYGCLEDHPDRVVPAFCQAAAHGTELHVSGRSNLFDFTHIEDVSRGVTALIKMLENGTSDLPPIHLVSGHGVTLSELADLAKQAGEAASRIIELPPRSYNVARFVGEPTRAWELLGWTARIDIADGVRRLVNEFRSSATGSRDTARFSERPLRAIGGVSAARRRD